MNKLISNWQIFFDFQSQLISNRQITPMLKGQKLATTVKYDQLMASQVIHAVKPHHPESLHNTINKSFVQNIESKKHADCQYLYRMKALQTDQLDMGLEEYLKNKQVAEIEKENTRKDYRERVNGVLGEIEKNIMNRSRMFQFTLIKQKQKQKRFIDEVAIKERIISNHVNRNYDQDVFLHQNDRYRQYQNLQHSQTLKINEMQKSQLQKKRQEQMQLKQTETHQRLEYEKNLDYQRYLEQQEKVKNQQKYQIELKRLVDQKKIANQNKPGPSSQHRRHNPITNPIQYHIDNPYILKRLEKYK